MDSLVAIRGEISSGLRKALAEASSREFFDGELEIEAGPIARFRLMKSVQYPISMTKLSADNCCLRYRRTHKHIRSNPSGLRIIWFVQRGSLKLTRSAGIENVRPGQVIFIDSNLPFHTETSCNDQGEYRSIQVLVPNYLFFPYLQEAHKLSRVLTLCGHAATSVEDILQLLEREGNWISKNLATALAHALLASLGDVLTEQNVRVARRERIFAERYLEYKKYILANLTDPYFNLEAVASHFGISARYVGYVFEENEITFSKLLWTGRLETGWRLLKQLPREIPIKHVALLSGFKSPAHFSRQFRNAYGVPPSLFRSNNNRVM